MIGQALTGTRGLSLTACCKCHINATLIGCCAPWDGKRPLVKCNGCDRSEQVMLWCAYCGKEQPTAYAQYDHLKAVEHLRELGRKKMQRLATRMAKSAMVSTVTQRRTR